MYYTVVNKDEMPMAGVKNWNQALLADRTVLSSQSCHAGIQYCTELMFCSDMVAHLAGSYPQMLSTVPEYCSQLCTGVTSLRSPSYWYPP